MVSDDEQQKKTTTTAFTSKQQPNISQLKIIITRRNSYAE
jgi:hypothetical protein